MVGPVIPIGPRGSSSYQLPNMAPLSQGLSALGQGIGRGFSGARERQDAERARKAKGLSDAELLSWIGESREGGDPLGGLASRPGLMSRGDDVLKWLGVLTPQAEEGKDRRIVSGADDFKYYADTGERVLPGVEKPEEEGKDRRIVLAADGFKYYDDTGERVLPGVEKPEEAAPAPRGIVNLMMPDGTLQAFRDGTPELEAALQQPGVTRIGVAVQAPSVDALGVGQKTEGTLEENVLKSEEALARLSEIAQSFDPAMLELPHQARTMFLGLKEKLGFDIGEEGRGQLEDYATFRQVTTNNLNLYIQDITGAQVSEKEAVRLMKTAPNLNDSPTQFRAKLVAIMGSLQAVQARARLALERGISRPSDLGTLEDFMPEEEASRPVPEGSDTGVPPSTGGAPGTDQAPGGESDVVAADLTPQRVIEMTQEQVDQTANAFTPEDWRVMSRETRAVYIDRLRATGR